MAQSSSNLGSIDAQIIYPLADFQKRSGLGRHAMRQPRRKGLRDDVDAMRVCVVEQLIRVGSRGFVRGADFLKWLDDQ